MLRRIWNWLRPSSTTATESYRLRRKTSYGWYGIVAAIFLWLVLPFEISLLLMPYLHWTMFGLLILGRVPRSFRVGDDGIHVGGLLPRFISFSEIKSIKFTAGKKRSNRDIVVALEKGKSFRIADFMIDADRFGTLRWDVGNRLKAFETRSDSLTVRLAKGNRSEQEWQRDLDELATVGYRVAPPRQEDLRELVMDPGADASARMAAAALLAETSENRHVISEAAMRTASPKVRVVLSNLAHSMQSEEVEVRTIEKSPRPFRVASS